MNTTMAGLMTGLALGFAGYFGGFGAFIVVAVLGLVGLIAGYLARGDVHVTDYVPTRSGEGRREPLDRPRSTYGATPRGTYGTGTTPRTEYRTRVR
ncbi:hypothetical protein CU044_2219 [Streptomyces sp. L-9-10]|uniref:hypothetical protein n=1 Tax=unclassified Streptomyces TaxID=2593676 RepID=UPI00101D7030|nr:hypothetical protein [Streptomyces sp. L-9-10]RYJ29126.1 hypothetical protein CU044_2219 [Streptomyces sp. L-9-10]